PFHAQLARDALGTRPPTQGPRDRCRVLYGHLSAVHGFFEVPVAPEPARPLSRLLPRLRNAVLVLLRRARAVLGEIHRYPARVRGPQALVPIDAGPGQTVTTAFLGVGVRHDVGPHLRQPRPEVEPSPDLRVGPRTRTRDRGPTLRRSHEQVVVGSPA